MTPAKLQQLLQQGLAHHNAGRLKEAESFYRQVRAVNMRSYDVLNLSGVLAYQQGRYADAVSLLTAALPLAPRPSLGKSRFQLGVVLAAAGRHSDAVAQFRAALPQEPANAEIWNSLAFSLRMLGQFAEAVAGYEKAIQLKPDYFDAIDRLGALMGDTKGLQAGIPYYRRALEINPHYAPAWGNLGLALSATDKHVEAIEAFDRALKLDPKLSQVRVGRALSLQLTYRMEEAAEEFSQAIALQPSNFEGWSGRLLTLNYLSGKSRQQLFDEHKAYGQAVQQSLRGKKPTTPTNPSPALNRKLRVAFLSQDFRKHSVAYFIEPILRHLDRSRFEVWLYHDHCQEDAVSARLRTLADKWHNFAGQFHEMVEQRIRADAPDILIDLAGHTGASRLPVFARRVAPVQISYLGYPNTTGIQEMDFRFVDAITDPSPEDGSFHTERLVRFAPCAWAYEPPMDAPEPAMPAGGTVTFGSFNNFAKISIETLQLWGRVLAAVPGSRLLIKSPLLDDPAIAESVWQKLRALGVDRSRIELVGRIADSAGHLGLYSKIDVALDPHPYNGTTTTCEALWMGVPVVTLRGDRHASRVSASLLTATGHTECIAASADDYVQIAAELAGDVARRAILRQRLREDMRKSPLCCATEIARCFGDALEACWREKIG
jgi:predicted O-linked N-acetylglucosamine transferase (SPINDLY family)